MSGRRLYFECVCAPAGGQTRRRPDGLIASRRDERPAGVRCCCAPGCAQAAAAGVKTCSLVGACERPGLAQPRSRVAGVRPLRTAAGPAGGRQVRASRSRTRPARPARILNGNHFCVHEVQIAAGAAPTRGEQLATRDAQIDSSKCACDRAQWSMSSSSPSPSSSQRPRLARASDGVALAWDRPPLDRLAATWPRRHSAGADLTCN
jgi:hypothetical protein